MKFPQQIRSKIEQSKFKIEIYWNAFSVSITVSNVTITKRAFCFSTQWNGNYASEIWRRQFYGVQTQFPSVFWHAYTIYVRSQNACSLYLFLLIVIVINPCDAIKHSFLIVLFNQKICLCINAWDSVGVFVSFCHILGPWVYVADMKRQVTDNFSGGRKAGARNGGIQNFCGNKLHMNEFIVYSWEIIWDAYAERVHRTINTNHPFTLRYMHKKTETNTENGEPFERTSIFNGWDKVSLIYVYRIWCKVCKTREKKERKKTSTT